MMVEVGEWHYNRVLEGGLDDGFTDSSGCGVDAQGLVEGLLGGFGAGGFSHMQGAPVGPAEGGGDALLPFEDSVKGGPTSVGALPLGTPSGASPNPPR